MSTTTPWRCRSRPHNDANPSVWVNHAVTVDASATPARPGSVGCPATRTTKARRRTRRVGSQWTATASTPSPARPGTTRSTRRGSRTRPRARSRCTSTRRHRRSSSSRRTPSDPTGLVVDATDNESGVASGSIEMAPAGTNDWTALPTTLNGARLATHFDDADRTGPYIFKATSCDNVGNCASANEQLTLPLRTSPDSQVSLTSIVSPRHHVVTERVLVGWHWVTISRDGRLSTSKPAGTSKRSGVVKTVQLCTIKMLRRSRARKQHGVRPSAPRHYDRALRPQRDDPRRLHHQPGRAAGRAASQPPCRARQPHERVHATDDRHDRPRRELDRDRRHRGHRGSSGQSPTARPPSCPRVGR